MSQNRCPACNAHSIHQTYARRRGVFFLSLGLAICAIGLSLLFTWFPSEFPWTASLSPADKTPVEILTHPLLVALTNALGLFTIGFGIWLITTPQYTCQQCGHTWWDESEEKST